MSHKITTFIKLDDKRKVASTIHDVPDVGELALPRGTCVMVFSEIQSIYANSWIVVNSILTVIDSKLVNDDEFLQVLSNDKVGWTWATSLQTLESCDPKRRIVIPTL